MENAEKHWILKGRAPLKTLTLKDIGFELIEDKTKKDGSRYLEYERIERCAEHTLFFHVTERGGVSMEVTDCGNDESVPLYIDEVEIIFAKMKELWNGRRYESTKKTLEDIGFKKCFTCADGISYERKRDGSTDDLTFTRKKGVVMVDAADYVFDGGTDLTLKDVETILAKMKDLEHSTEWDEGVDVDHDPESNIILSEPSTISVAKEFKNEIIGRLNEYLDRYKHPDYSDTEFFVVDEVYEMLDRVFNGIPEDDGSID